MTGDRNGNGGRGGWRDVVISVLAALIIGLVSGMKIGARDVLSEQRVRDLAKEENAALREAVTDLKGSVGELTKSVNALTVQITVLQSRGRS